MATNVKNRATYQISIFRITVLIGVFIEIPIASGLLLVTHIIQQEDEPGGLTQTVNVVIGQDIVGGTRGTHGVLVMAVLAVGDPSRACAHHLCHTTATNTQDTGEANSYGTVKIVFTKTRCWKSGMG